MRDEAVHTPCLIFDSSLRGTAVAVGDLDRAKVCAYRATPEASTSHAMVGMFRDALDEAGVTVPQLHAVAVSRGPGSFTGIKMGLSFVQGLSRSAPHLQVMGFSSFAELAKVLVKDERTTHVVMAGSRRKGVCCTVEAGLETTLLPVDLEDGVPDHFDGKIPVVSLGEWPELSQANPELSKVLIEIPMELALLKGVEAMLSVASASWPAVGMSSHPDPIYLRRSAPEERLRKEGRL